MKGESELSLTSSNSLQNVRRRNHPINALPSFKRAIALTAAAATAGSLPACHAWSISSCAVLAPPPPLNPLTSSSTLVKSLYMSALDVTMKQQQLPSMFLCSKTKSSLQASLVSKSTPPRYRLREPDPTSSKSCINQNERNPRRVLGFDVLGLSAASTSNVDRETWNYQSDNLDDGGAFFPAPGLAWNSQQTSAGGLPASISAMPRSMIGLDLPGPSSSSSSPQYTRAPTIRTTKTFTTAIPSWFPWIPTKSQIDSLKVSELRLACEQRALNKSGKKDELRSRMWQWTLDQQQRHQRRIKDDDDFMLSWFKSTSDTVATTTADPQQQQQQQQDTPNSLGEWARTVDLEPLLQKRKDIHRRKRQGRSHDAKQQQLSAPTTTSSKKEYLLELTKALQAPSVSNVRAKEIYMASKQADQLGERQVSIDLLEALLKVTPNDARVYRRLARMYSEQYDLDQSRATLQLGLRRMPDNPWLWHGFGQLEVTHGGSDKRLARQHFQKAIEVDPTFAHSYHALGMLEYNQGNIARAMKILKQGVEYCPSNHRLHHALGDLYRGAKLLKDAERSYKRALEHGPLVSHCFALSALACVSYELGDVNDARRWLRKAVKINEGRHAQGWVSMAQLEEAEGNPEKARLISMNAIMMYERGLIEMRQRYKQKRQYKEVRGEVSNDAATGETLANKTSLARSSEDLKNMLLQTVPQYRSGDKFVRVYRNWARLEEKYGSFETVDQVYERASTAFPLDFRLSLDWARYHAGMLNHERARQLFMEACKKTGNRHADPYRVYAEMEMSLGNYGQARRILFKGAQLTSQSSDGGLGSNRGLAELFQVWAICEWHLRNPGRAEVLLDNALRLTKAGDDGSEMRSFILYTIARLEYYLEEYHLAQHCVGLCLKENSMPGGNARVWRLWRDIAKQMDNPLLEQQCSSQLDKEGDTDLEARVLDKGSTAMQHLLRREPWQHKLFGSKAGTPSAFFDAVRFPRSQRVRRVAKSSSSS